MKISDRLSQCLTPALIKEITEIVFGLPDHPIQPCDLIFVFGGSHPGLWQTAAQAYHAGLGKIILVTGGIKPGVQHHHTWRYGNTPEADVIRREMIELAVPVDFIVCENKSTNTLENVLFAQDLFDFSTINSILAVCKNYGTGRQCRTLKWQISNSIKVIPYPFDTEAGNGPYITRKTWMDYAESTALILTQLVKIYRYGKWGHLEPIDELSPALENLLRSAAT